jgi:hypothetical protein
MRFFGYCVGICLALLLCNWIIAPLAWWIILFPVLLWFGIWLLRFVFFWLIGVIVLGVVGMMYLLKRDR